MSTHPGPPNIPDPIRSHLGREASGPIRVVVEQSSGLGRFGRRLMWFVLGISIMANLSLVGMYQSYFQTGDEEIHEKYHSLKKEALDKVAIITVDGTIMSGEGFIKHQIDRVRRDEHVKAVVLRISSPGGTVTGSDYIYHHLKDLIKEKQVPLVVSMGSIAASGGYYIAMAAGDGEKLIYAEPTTWTGSIGVIIPHFDVSELLKRWDVKDDSVASHPLKQMGSPTRMLPTEFQEEERKILKDLVDESFTGFKEIVLASRPTVRESRELQDTVFTGRIFTASQAKRSGLVDELGFIEDAIDRAIALASLDKDDVRVVKYTKPKGLLEQSLFGSEGQARGMDMSALLELAAPRAYYLCTMLPTVGLSPRLRGAE